MSGCRPDIKGFSWLGVVSSISFLSWVTEIQIHPLPKTPRAFSANIFSPSSLSVKSSPSASPRGPSGPLPPSLRRHCQKSEWL